MRYHQRPAVSELGKFLTMTQGEWEAELIAMRVDAMMNARLHFSFFMMCRLIWLTLTGQPVPKVIPL